MVCAPSSKWLDVSRAVQDSLSEEATQKVLQFQSLGTLTATSAWALPGVVGLPFAGLAEIGLAGTVWLPFAGRCWPALEALLLFRLRHTLKSP